MHSNFSRRNFLRNAALTTGLAAAGTSGLAMGETLSTPASEQKLPREVWIAALSQSGLTATSSEQMIYRLLQIIRITLFHDEEWAIIESLSSDVSVDNIMKEYDFKTFTQHKKSAEVVQIEMRNKS